MASDQVQPKDDPTELRQLDRFCRAVASSPDHQVRLQSCASPEEILAFATELQCPFSWQTLRSRSSDLAADCWPWAQKGTTWRRQFFQA
ncbi:MAG: Nif11-like leader peptide family natural product precursor [Cyanobacteriota bacterium]